MSKKESKRTKRKVESALSKNDDKRKKIQTSNSSKAQNDKKISKETLLVKPDQPWYKASKIKESWRTADATEKSPPPSPAIIDQAAQLYQTQLSLYDRTRDLSKSDRDWLEALETGGTAKDRAAAFLLQIQEAPFYNGPRYLGRLMEMFQRDSRHEALLALEALRDAFIAILGCEGPLWYWKQRRFEGEGLSAVTMLRCHFEDSIKRTFFGFLKVLEVCLQDQLLHVREQSTRALWQLLAGGCTEQQGNMLALLVNKLGDVERKLASRVGYYLEELIKTNQNNGSAVVGHLQAFLQRPGLPERAQYYALRCCSQFRLSHGMPELTAKLMQIYVNTFKAVVLPAFLAISNGNSKKKKKKIQRKSKAEEHLQEQQQVPRLAKAVLSGLNRALPFWKPTEGDNLRADLLEPIQRLIEKSPSLSALVPALSLNLHLIESIGGSGMTEGFVASLEAVLAKRQLALESSIQPALLALIYRTLVVEDCPESLVMRLLKALMRSLHTVPQVAYTAASILLLHDLFQRKPSLRSLLQSPGMPEEKDDVPLYEPVYLARNHFDPRVREYSQALLEGRPISESFIQNSPFESLTPSRYFLEIAHAKEGCGKKAKKVMMMEKSVDTESDVEIDEDEADVDEEDCESGTDEGDSVEGESDLYDEDEDISFDEENSLDEDDFNCEIDQNDLEGDFAEASETTSEEEEC